MSTQEMNDAQAREDAKRLGRFKILYPGYQFAAAMSKAFSTYVTYFYTNVFMFSVTFTATITLCASLISWIGTPVFSAFLDRFSFKNAKFWPYVLVGSVVVNGGTILIIALPALTGKTVELMGLVFAIRMAMTLLAPLNTAPISASFPRLSKDPKDRQYFAMSQKIGRDGGKTIFGYIVPAMLLALSGGGQDPTMGGYAITAFICYGITILGMWAYALFGLRGSYVEREALKDTAAAKKAKVPLTAMIKVIFGNRAVLGMFFFFGFHKSYYFIYTSYASYVFRYVYQDFGKIGTFMTVFNLLSIIGVMAGPFWHKIFKDSKKDLIAAFAAHMLCLVAILFTFKSVSANTFIIIFGASSFFMGMLENWVLPGYAAASEYGAWISGSRMDALIMAVYNLTMSVCHIFTTLVATFILNSFDYSGWLVKYKAEEVGITDEVVNGLSNLFSVAPLVLAAIAMAFLLFVYNMNDKKLKAIQEDLAAGKTKATSTIDFKAL